ncbi:MAG: UDP-N-acetylmuramoyl-tripeptide--D-alanyl-D-alanine ligase [Gemmatimonadota bacterium]|nr:MAG: UDP-N-acetylmuramoyl-tripeptide--D-alanyl-D-alanine ligase [Gemmatimonadota bacterium]
MVRFSWSSQSVRQALGLPAVEGSPRTYTGVCTDTRVVRPGELFVALTGEHFDGADFVGDAAKAGARGAVVERCTAEFPVELELFLVDDALRALGDLAALRRRALGPTVIGITGTSGKTTTRVITAAALGPEAYGSPGNYNNLVGLPLSILRAPEAAAIWVLEIASNQPGEVERLGRVAEPEYGVVTSVSEGHLEGLGDLRGVLDEKLSLLSTMRADGHSFVADQPAELASRAREIRPQTRTVGLERGADVHPDSWSLTRDGVSWRWQGVEFGLAGHGLHLIRDAMFALAIADRLGLDLVEVSARVRGASLPPMRGEIRQLDGLTLLVDCYNANPASFRAAIETLTALAEGRRRAALVGTMLELGGRAGELHEQVAAWLVDAGIEIIAAVGEFAAPLSRLRASYPGRVILEEDVIAAYGALAAELRGDEVVLVKASRGMRFERTLSFFGRDFGGQGDLEIDGSGASEA